MVLHLSWVLLLHVLLLLHATTSIGMKAIKLVLIIHLVSTELIINRLLHSYIVVIHITWMLVSVLLLHVGPSNIVHIEVI